MQSFKKHHEALDRNHFPIAYKDNTDVDQPISGADDGVSGVAVLLEIARLSDQINDRHLCP